MAIRKIFVLALTVPLCALAVACGGGEMPEAQAPDTETAATPEAPEAPSDAPAE